MNLIFKIASPFIEKIITPYTCVICLETSDQKRDICSHCQNNLPLLVNTCLQCGIAFSKTHRSERCGQCLKHSPHFDNTVVGFDYRSPIDGWLRQFKFHKKGLYARLLTEIYIEKLARLFEQQPEQIPQVLIPMPLHWRRLAQRGFNQAHTIAQYLSQHFEIPIVYTSVTRTRYTKAQSSLGLLSRKSNIQGAFLIRNLNAMDHVAIIDDIITTGSTVNELSKQLKFKGVCRVSVWALARVN